MSLSPPCYTLHAQQAPADGRFGNYTLDDAAKSITYTGFTASANAPTPSGKSKGSSSPSTFYRDTITYTSSSDALASFTFASSLIQIFGPVGPAFGTFQVTVDEADYGTYTATRHGDSGGHAVLLWMGQFQAGQHQVEVKNLQDGQSLALDFMRADGQYNADWLGAGGAGGKGKTVVPVGETGVFPGDGKSEGKSAVGAIIGGVLAGLFVLVRPISIVLRPHRADEGARASEVLLEWQGVRSKVRERELISSWRYYYGGAYINTAKQAEKDLPLSHAAAAPGSPLHQQRDLERETSRSGQ